MFKKKYPKEGPNVTQGIANNARHSAPFKLMRQSKTKFVLSQVGKDLGKLGKLKEILYGDNILHSSTTFDIEFRKFALRFPCWSATGEYGQSPVFLTKYEHIDHFKIVRRQQIAEPSGGHMLAPIIMQHYLVAINSHGSNTNSTNLGLLVRDMVHAHDISGLIDGKFKITGDSWEFLSTLLGNSLGDGLNTLEGDQYEAWYNRPTGDDSPYPFNELMRKAQSRPALVSEFILWNDFKNLTLWSHTEKPVDYDVPRWQGWTTFDAERHSMVMIGARKSADNQFYFLLQNTWKGKYFVEVSGDYLAWCEAKITFISNRDVKLIDKVRRTASFFVCDFRELLCAASYYSLHHKEPWTSPHRLSTSLIGDTPEEFQFRGSAVPANRIRWNFMCSDFFRSSQVYTRQDSISNCRRIKERRVLSL